MKSRFLVNAFNGRSGERIVFVTSALLVHGILSACGGLFSESIAQRSQRIRDFVQVTPEGLRSSSGYVFWDSEHDLECTFVPVEGGLTRCIPTTFAVTNYYGDSSCENKVAGVSLSACGARLPSFAKFGRQIDGACPTSVYSVVELGGRHEGPVFTSLSGECTEAEGPGDLTWFEIERTTPDVDWAEGEFVPDL